MSEVGKGQQKYSNGTFFVESFGVADFIYEIYFERCAPRTSQNKFHSRIKQGQSFFLKVSSESQCFKNW